MTLNEVSLRTGLKPITLYKNYAYCQKTLKKRGILLFKWGRGKDVDYEIVYMERDEDGNFIEE